jgi:predicted ATPase
MATIRAIGTAAELPWYLALLAQAHADVGQTAEGLDAITEALALVASTKERFYEAEIYRVKGELLFKHGRPDTVTEAESCFRRALDIAEGQSAKSWELRAATSLARLWRDQGQRTQARELLAPVYRWFTEGCDTPDLKTPRRCSTSCVDFRSWASSRLLKRTRGRPQCDRKPAIAGSPLERLDARYRSAIPSSAACCGLDR